MASVVESTEHPMPMALYLRNRTPLLGDAEDNLGGPKQVGLTN